MNREISNRRDILAMVLIGFSFLAIIVISVLYFKEPENSEHVKNLFNALLPLMSTWIGTVLAFYFGREAQLGCKF
ncbi:hypothetical protein [Flavobacterium cyanobacteriorum]|nr:hypothetical protein [Flavobacterium cyanobacteriorum]